MESNLNEVGAREDAGADSPSALPPGARLGNYEIVAVLARGSASITYRARDAQLARDVAIKEYLPAFAARPSGADVAPRSAQTAKAFRKGRDRFLADANALAQLKDVAGIVSVHEVLEQNGTAYVVMALMTGETLESRLLRDRRLSRLAIERILTPLLDGLQRAHEAHCLHRDIKPANILIDRTDHPTLIDFGAPRKASQPDASAAAAVPAPDYAAPEQFTSAQRGPWTDIYSLGATLYHCVTGEPPPNATDRVQRDTMVPATQAARGHYAPTLLAFIDAALKLKEDDRPQSIAEWRRIMLTVPPPAQAKTATPATGRSGRSTRPDASRRRPAQAGWSILLAVGLVALTVAGGGAFFWQRAEDEAARKVAEERAVAEAEAKRQAEEMAARKAQETARAAAAAWVELQNSDDPARLRSFAGQFPGTPEARMALQRADQLEAAARRRADEEAARRAAEAQREKARAAATAWAELQNSEDPARLRSFAGQFPGTPEAQLALNRASQVEAAAKRRAQEEAARRAAEAAREKARAATAAWAELQNSDDPARLQRFADQFPGTPEARQALDRADELKATNEQARRSSEREAGRDTGPREPPRAVTYPDGSRYVGGVVNNQRSGQGTYTYANGDRYIGTWLNDDMHGRGTYTWADGGRYVGEWRNDKLDGRGIRTWPDGDRYEGEWHEGKKSGKGTYTFGGRDRYVGSWVDDQMHGQGVYTWADGGRYEGEWRNDKKSGRGIRTWANGDRYEGEWQNDRAHGKGTRRDADGDVFDGRWQNGCFMEGNRTVAVGAPLKECER